jgi:hypothetical protein
MDETRESCLAAILARGLMRVRQRAERLGQKQLQGDEPEPTAPDQDADDYSSADRSAAGNPQGEPS